MSGNTKSALDGAANNKWPCWCRTGVGLAEAAHGESPLHRQFVAATINRLAAEDAIFTADVGTRELETE